MEKIEAVNWMRIASILAVGALAWMGVEWLAGLVRRELLARIKLGLDEAGIPNPTQRLRLVPHS